MRLRTANRRALKKRYTPCRRSGLSLVDFIEKYGLTEPSPWATDFLSGLFSEVRVENTFITFPEMPDHGSTLAFGRLNTEIKLVARPLRMTWSEDLA